MIRSAVEKTIQYATNVDTLEDAWSFVMKHMDDAKGRPRIMINPIIWPDDLEPMVYEVSIEWMEEENG